MFEAGALVLIPFPFSDLSASKRRPVLVLTAPDEYGDFTGMAVSSRTHHVKAIALGTAQLVEGSMPRPSWVRVDRVVTLNAALVVKVFAMTKADFRHRAVDSLCQSLRQA